MQRCIVIERSGKNRIERKHTSFPINACSLLPPIQTLFLIKLMLFSRGLTEEIPN